MRQALVFTAAILLFGCSTLSAQILWQDDFSDGNFTANPSWSGPGVRFQISTNQELQLNDVTNSSPSFLGTNSTALSDASWEFWVRLDFAPSTSNFSRVYLVSDNADFSGSLNGYYVQIGGASGTVDDVSLYRQQGSSGTKIIDGIDGVAATNPVLRVRVTRNAAGLWELFVDDTGGSAFVSQGFTTDNNVTSSQFFGVYCRYTSTRSDKFFFDDFVVTGPGSVDTIKPVINQVEAISANRIDVVFSEAVDVATATDVSHYSVDQGIGNPSTAVIKSTDSSVVELSYGNAFTNGTTYQISVNDVADRNGNIMLNATESFLYFVPVAPSYRDVVINEIFADFSPQVGLPTAEFVELYNASNEVFDLNGWTFSDATSTVTLSNQTLSPGDYLILCASANTAAFQAFGTTQGVANFPSLNNAGDQLSLRDDQGNLVDFVAYDDDWYQDATKESGGWTLEQINPNTSCTGKINFRASVNSNGGTPGIVNSIFNTNPDTQAPILEQTSLLAADSILLVFNELLDSNSVQNATYTISSGATVAQVLNQPPAYTSVLLVLNTPLDSGVISTITVSNVSDCSGNLIGNQNTGNIVLPGIPSSRDVVINEIFADFSPVIGLPEAEFIELYNASDKIFDLGGWTLGDGSTNSTLSPLIFQPGDYVIICANGNETAYQAFGPTQGQDAFPSLNNSGDQVELKDARGLSIDVVNYTDAWYNNEIKQEGGWTLEQINPEKACGGRSNFTASTSSTGGTPGQENSVLDNSLDTQGPQLLTAFVLSADSILLRFNEGLDIASAANANYQFSTSASLGSAQAQAPDYEEVLLVLSTPLTAGETTTITVTLISDCSGNVIGENNEVKVALPQTVEAGDLVINEVLFNPNSGGSDFVELYNRSEKIISLENLQMANSQGDSISSIRLITSEAVLLFPGEYVGLTERISNIVSNYRNTRIDRFLEVDDLPTYNDTEGTVYLLDENNATIDFFAYLDDYHFPLLADDEGVSLERISPERATNDPDNWHSAAEVVGFATPGFENSQLSVASRFSGEVSVEPELFSPDNDGFNDVVNINYQFQTSGYSASVTIYDDRGREIRKLVNNQLLGTERGSFSWDGITEDQQKARIGIYIIFFEAFHPDGDQQSFKKTCVLAGQVD